MKKILIAKRFTALLWALVLTLMPMSLMADNAPLSVTVTFEVGSFVYEQAGNAFDGKPETKWCGGILTTNNTNASVQVQLAEKSKLDYYYLYTGNDINYKDDDSQQQRNPKEWKLYAKVNEGDEWTLISHVTDAGLPTTVSTRSNNYKIDAAYQNIEYNYLKFEILQIEKGDIFEVGEICFIKCNHTFGSDDICTECGYEKQEDDDFVTVASASQMYNVLSGNAYAKVRLTADIYLSDLGADFEDTFCSTFYGILDGDGHAIKGDHYADNTTQRRNRTYLFTYSDGATIKNITFKHINKSSTAHDNQCILTSQAKNNCVFENITFDNCGASCDDKTNGVNVGAVVGSADHCIFTNITVKNSDFTVEFSQVGAVVGKAKNCTLTNIKVDNCKITSHYQSPGGVAGRADDCTISNVEILGTFIKADDNVIGGVVGNSTRSDFINCIVDDQSCVCTDGKFSFNNGTFGEVGGIVGRVYKGSFTNCINSALIAADGNWVGGIVGSSLSGGVDFEDCLNTGMVISMDMSDVEGGFYNKYKTKSGLTCVTKTYKGKEYVIRKYEAVGSDSYMGGIVGEVEDFCTINRCANLGSVYSTAKDYVGGIAGRISLGKVTNCLTDFHAGRYTDAICAAIGDDDGGECFIGSCLNMTTYKDFSAYSNNWDGFKSDEKNYSLTTNKDAHHVNRTTAAKIKSGEICHLLGEAWEQNLGTEAYPTPTGDRGIYHMRDVNCKDYGTICVPFPLETLKGVGIDRREYYLFDEVKNEADGTISICFKYTDVVPAGTPAIFRAYVNSDYYFLPMEKEYQFEVQPTVGTEWTFNGTFEQKVFEGNDAKSIYYLDGTAGSSAIKNAKKTTIAPYRAYFEGPSIDKLTGSNGASQARAVRFVIEDEDGETTALELVGDDLVPVQQGAKSYSLMGTEVSDGYRGLVIRNGKKVITSNN